VSITVTNLDKIYGSNHVVRQVSFAVEEGEFVSLLGPSGCGKTTTLRCIAGLEEANAGSIAIDGKTVTDPVKGIMAPPHGRDIGMVFQSYAVWPHMTVAENVGFPLKIRRAAAKQMAERVEWALGIVGLSQLRDRQPSQLSGGQQQRVALARAIVGQPRVLLFDEPLSNLDAKLRDVTRAEIRRLQRELNIATVYVTHDQAEALSMSDRVIVMDHGRIMQVGEPRDLYRRPANRFVADFVGVASFVDVMPADRDQFWKLPDGTIVGPIAGPAAGSGLLQLMLRPENVELIVGDPPAQSSEIRLKGSVQEAHYLGAFTEYVVAVAGSQVRVHSPADIDVGTAVTLAFAGSGALIIPGDA
jgi:ABC-type Fe3+/spermidine/putrescine transport system ATPase subunit